MQRAHVIQSKDPPGALRVQGQNYEEKDSKRLKSSKSRKVEQRSLMFLDFFSKKLRFDLLRKKCIS